MRSSLHNGLLTALAVLFLSSCGLDIGGGSQRSGQRCFQPSDCAEGLTCNQRVCVPLLGNGGVNNELDASNNTPSNTDAGPSVDFNNRPDGGPIDMPPPIDTGTCEPGEVRCASPSVIQFCEADGLIVEELCPPDSVCEGGACIFIGPECIDEDGDGYGPGCRLGDFDCDPFNPNVSPGNPERCGNFVDDNCDGRFDEGCDPDGCCPGGCGPDAFCTSECFCQGFDPFFCEFQDQPCFNEGEFDNGFVCAAFGADGQARCWGLCSINVDEPNTTCPEPGSVCAFDAGDGQTGICMSPCGFDSTGVFRTCSAGLGCLNVDVEDGGDGICVPTNPNNQRGERCDLDYFFDCDEGLICVQGAQGGGRCREACRPFYWGPGGATDCDQGHCLAYAASIGVCTFDNGFFEGEQCGPPSSTCNEDAVGCFDLGDGNECVRLCRLEDGDDDCLTGSCTQFDMQQTEVGVCF